MNLTLFRRLFITQFLLLLSIALACVGLVSDLLTGSVVWEFLQGEIYGIALYSLIAGVLFSIAFVYALAVTISIGQPLEEIRAKLNWLLLGKYHHEIFSLKTKSSFWFGEQGQVHEEIERLRQRFISLSQDLQEFSAAPTFVGNESKEEIIEEERARIARELHDSVSQQLFAGMMLVSSVNQLTQVDQPVTDKLVQRLKQIEHTIHAAQFEMRALLLHLRPFELKDRSLSQGIQSMLRELQGKLPMDVDWDLMEDVSLESGIEDHLFRVIQEAVSNTLRHAQASKLYVSLQENGGEVQLSIQDNGCGFEVNKVERLGNYGLANMRERIASFDGRLDIMSMPGEGTQIHIRIPQHKKRREL